MLSKHSTFKVIYLLNTHIQTYLNLGKLKWNSIKVYGFWLCILDSFDIQKIMLHNSNITVIQLFNF